MLIDAHCHLERETFGDELEAVLERAWAAGLTHLIAVGSSNRAQGAAEAIALAEKHANIFVTVGLHPHEAAKVDAADEQTIGQLLGHPKVVALGEVGLDYHYDFAPRATQQALFRRQAALAKERDRPLMLHTREAHADTLAILDEVGLPAAGGVVHCFTGSSAEASDYLKRDLYLSVPGAVTFRNADNLRAAVRSLPLERLLLETDSPYLAPVPFRGKRNEPCHLVQIAETIAGLHGLAAEDIGRITRQNAIDLFRLPVAAGAAIAYPIRDSLYINLTSRCTLACRFCPKIASHDWWVRGHWLKLDREPSVDEVLGAIEAAIAQRATLQEIVFVGLGEASLRLPELLTISRRLRESYGQRFRLRLDTDGLANLVHGRDVTLELAAVLDSVSVSLNAADAPTYARWCVSKYGEAAYPAVKDFIRSARQAGLDVTASVVTVPGVEVEACRKIVEDELHVRFRVRTFQQVG